MLPSTETIEQTLDELKALPPHSCPDVDRMLKILQSEEKDASLAADAALNHSRLEEDRVAAEALDDAHRALEGASTAINDAAVALDHERDIASALRDGCDSRESIAKLAIQGCADRDERIQNLEAECGELEGRIDAQDSQLDTRQRVISHLGAQIKASWWTKMANAGKRLRLERRVRGMKRRIARMQRDMDALSFHNSVLFDALLVAERVLADQEWEHGPFGQKWCPSCHAIDGGHVFGPYPKHVTGCHIGEACEVIRWALQSEARDHGIDPQHVGCGRREFPA